MKGWINLEAVRPVLNYYDFNYGMTQPTYGNPTWVIYCSIEVDQCWYGEGQDTYVCCGIVDNEIDAVTVAENHIKQFSHGDEDHRPHMHMCANTGVIEIDRDKNLYRPAGVVNS